MTDDQQEAESRKYSNDAVVLLKLRSGRIAVFNATLKLDRIIEAFPFDFTVIPVEPPPRRAFNSNVEVDL